MRRDPLVKLETEIVRKSKLESTNAIDSLRMQGGTGSGGINIDGEWVPFGRLDITPLDTLPGFILSDRSDD